MRIRTLVRARCGLLRTQLDLANQIRGARRTFGLMLDTGWARQFEAEVRYHLADRPDLAPIGLALPEAWATIRRQVYRLDREGVRKLEGPAPELWLAGNAKGGHGMRRDVTKQRWWLGRNAERRQKRR